MKMPARDVLALALKAGRPDLAEQARQATRGNKYGAKRTQAANGRTYDSKAEAAFADLLGEWKARGQIEGWLEQVPFVLPGGTVYRCDFLLFSNDPSDPPFTACDVKGHVTQVWKVKWREVRAAYPWMTFQTARLTRRSGQDWWEYGDD